MAPLILAALLAFSAIAAADRTQVTWGSVVFVYHGEKAPLLGSTDYFLSPLGANQLFDAGSVVRDRYVDPPTDLTDPLLQVGAQINGLGSRNIDNTQLSILSTDDEYVTSSAVAFMQGLYPSGLGMRFDPQYKLSNGTYIGYPLDQYQYPNIGTVNYLDFNYIWIAGNQECTTYSISEIQTLSSTTYNSQIANTTAFYNSLSSAVFADLDPAVISYRRAYDLYEYALYEYNHSPTVFHTLAIEDLERLHALASQQQFEMNSPNSQGTISAIAGNTFASKVLQQFNSIIASSGVSNKLTLLFGSYEPFLSFFALSGLSTGIDAQKFNDLPEHGSVMAFELYSYTADGAVFNESAPFPTTDELWVRFMFRNGTNETDSLVSYPLFNRGPSNSDMSWSDFVTGMGSFSLSEVADWCTVCLSDNLFCAAIMANMGNDTDDESSGKKTLSPVIGGVIGATITIGLFILIALILLLLGFRLDYHEKRANGTSGSEAGGIGVLKRNISGGGFKGAEKLASDTDLRLKGGAGATIVRHERVGSWELNESPTASKHTSLDKEIESERAANYERRSEDGIGNVNPFGDPVKAVDHI